MSKFEIIVRALKASNDDTIKKGVGCCCLSALFAPLVLVVFIVVVISQPVEWLKDVLFGWLTEREVAIVRQIRYEDFAGIIEDGKLFYTPIDRPVREYFSDVQQYITYNSDGDDIYAVADGTVIEAQGTTIWIEHEVPDEISDYGVLVAKYWPVNVAEGIVPGEDVERGQIIGQGNEYNSTQQFDNEQLILMDFYFVLIEDYGGGDETYIDPVDYIAIIERQESENTIIGGSND